MSDHLVADGTYINSIVGEGTRFRGDLELNGLLRIDGDYSGTIRTPGKVLVGKNGRAECTIHAGTVVVGGVVKGDIHSSEKVIVLSTGMILGNVATPRLIVESGVILNGECLIKNPSAAPKSDSLQEKPGKIKPDKEYQPADFKEEASPSDNGDREGAFNPDSTQPSSQAEREKLSAWKG